MNRGDTGRQYLAKAREAKYAKYGIIPATNTLKSTGKPKRKRVVNGLKPGEAIYVAESLKPGITRAQAARNAGLEFVPSGKMVKQYREELLRKQLELADITAERIALEIGRVAFSDPGQMFDANGGLLPIQDMPEDIRRCISGFDVEKRTETVWNEKANDGEGDFEKQIYIVMRPRLWSKNQALDTLASMRYSLDGKLKMPDEGGGKSLTPAQPVVHVHFVAPEQKTLEGSSV
jgi:hypothetical protein